MPAEAAEPRVPPPTPDDLIAFTVYELSRWLARLGWLILAVSLFVPASRPYAWPAAQFVIPAIFCLAYIFMVWQGRSGFKRYGLRTFFDLDHIGYLYTNRSALNASWLHFLALDLFAGAWIVQDGLSIGMPAWLILLCLPFVLMLAPVGLLLYFALRLLVM